MGRNRSLYTPVFSSIGPHGLLHLNWVSHNYICKNMQTYFKKHESLEKEILECLGFICFFEGRNISHPKSTKIRTSYPGSNLCILCFIIYKQTLISSSTCIIEICNACKDLKRTVFCRCTQQQMACCDIQPYTVCL